MKTRLLDVTLRDGGYRNRFCFTPEQADYLVGELAGAGIDRIEVGYRNGPLRPLAGAGLTARTPTDYLRALVVEHPKAKLSVMLHPHNVSFGDLREIRDAGATLVRVCLNFGEMDSSLAFVREAKKLGLEVSANLTRITCVEMSRALDAAGAAREAGADVIYFADSNGHMIPEQVARYVREFRTATGAPVGFHAHNNLSLALANSIAAAEAGAGFIDASLRGMGKGAGNLALEVCLSYLDRKDLNPGYDTLRVLKAADFWSRSAMRDEMTLPVGEILFGKANFSSDFAEPIRRVAVEKNVGWHNIAYELGKAAPKTPSLEQIHGVAERLKGERA